MPNVTSPKFNQVLSRTQTLAIVLSLWAAVYLPALGSLAIKGEEGRRILPAISMLESGNYLVPEVGGEAYFRKPPLINWLVAVSFKLFGARNEWTARLPSSLAVLAVAVAFVTVARASLGPRGSTIAAIIWLTNIGIMEKGRLIEIEGLYVSLFGLALIFWLSFWQQKKSAWLIWIPASIFLGLGWLAKGPVHLVFFYGVVLAVAWKSRNWRQIFHPAHLIGILLMLGIFAAWAIPFAHTAGSATATTKWTNQFTGRLKGTDFEFRRWVRNIPQGLVYFLPWLVLLPLVQFNIFSEDKDRHLARGLAWGAVVPFLLVLLVPGSIPRYAMPALVPACWLLAMTLCEENLRWPRWTGAWIGLWIGVGIGVGVGNVVRTGVGAAIAVGVAVGVGVGVVIGTWSWSRLGGKSFSFKARRRMIIAVVALACVSMWTYAMAIVPKMHQRQRVKRLAEQIDAAVPRSDLIYALDPNYQPIFFYLKSRLAYASEVHEIPVEAIYLLVRPQREDEVMESNRWAPRKPHRVLRMTDYRKETILLLKIE
jgi:4-amino-4-deoxy-L-arabinose transferase-like glycosyltransferase